MVIKKYSRFMSGHSFSPACEAAVMKALNHPNIVRSHSTSRWLTDVYIAMEYLNGGDLRKLKIQGSEGLIATVMREALKGLAHMHEQNYAHCDIKPDNIFLSKNGEVKIGDLGCVRDVRAGDGGVGRGTPGFEAPETRVGIHSTSGDIWSLAVTAIKQFTGVLPRSPVYDYYLEKTTPPIPKHASSEFKEFLELATEFDWQKRATAQELLNLPFIKNAPPTSTLIPVIQAKKP